MFQVGDSSTNATRDKARRQSYVENKTQNHLNVTDLECFNPIGRVFGSCILLSKLFHQDVVCAAFMLKNRNQYVTRKASKGLIEKPG